MEEISWSEIEVLAQIDVRSLIAHTESVFDSKIIDIANCILEKEKCKLILIAGPSASGKTTSTKLLVDRLQRAGKVVHMISTDDFFKNRDELKVLESGARDFDSLEAVKVDLLQSVLAQLLEGKQVKLPRFDFLTGCEKEGELLQIGYNDTIILEGIHALNPIILEKVLPSTKQSIVRIYIEPQRAFRLENGQLLLPEELRLIRRLSRDFYKRGHSFEATLIQWKEVLRAERLYIKPYKKQAEYCIDSTYEYELIVYKQCIFKEIKKSRIKLLEKIEDALKNVDSMPIKNIPYNSLLNEFVKMENS